MLSDQFRGQTSKKVSLEKFIFKILGGNKNGRNFIIKVCGSNQKVKGT